MQVIKGIIPGALLIFAFFGGVALILNSSCAVQNEKTPPNIILFFIDDLGWTDLSCYGSDVHETPAIDKLASSGVVFTDAYSACTVCSPSRAALMTGKYPARLHITDWITGHIYPDAKLKVPDWTMYLDTAEITLAEQLKKAGYVTANIGKWHLGEDSLHWPENQGFDINIGGYNRGQPGSYFFPYDGGRSAWGVPPNLSEGTENEYITYRLTEEASRFIRENKQNKFFLYFPHYTVHTPLQAPDSLIKYYEEKIKEGDRHHNAVYAAMVHTLDQSVGQIMKVLEEEGLVNNTVVLLTSDNGGLVVRGNVTDNTPLREGKGSVYEGGVRVPLIARVPGVSPGGTVCTETVITMDLYPTIMKLAGLEGIENDGKNLVPLLQNPEDSLDRLSVFWHYPHYHPGGATPYSSVRQDEWKLIYFFEDDNIELYNLDEDISESNDLASRMPEKVSELKQTLELWWEETGAQMPIRNPGFKTGQ